MANFIRACVAAALIIGTAGATGAVAQESGARTILVFGDSLTWGWVPTSPVTPTTRHAPQDRWTAALSRSLGEGYTVIAEGLSGRTTNIDDPTDPKLNGSAVLPALLASHEPVDLVIIMLGTNDTKTYLNRSPFEIALGAGELINQVQEMPGWDWTDYEPAAVLLINPPPLGAEIGAEAQEAFDEASKEKSRALTEMYAGIARLAGEHHFDAGSVIQTDGVDGIHFTAEANRRLGEAVAEEVKRILGE